VNKLYVGKLMQKLFMPIEKSYYSLNDLIMIKLSKFDNMEELNEFPELITNKALKDVNHLYAWLGYQMKSSPGKNSPVKYNLKTNFKNKVASDLYGFKIPIMMPIDKNMPTMKINNSNIPDLKKQDRSDTPPMPSKISLKKLEGDNDDLTISIGSINDELDYMLKPMTCKGDTVHFNFYSPEEHDWSEDENYYSSPNSPMKKVRNFDKTLIHLPTQKVKKSFQHVNRILPPKRFGHNKNLSNGDHTDKNIYKTAAHKVEPNCPNANEITMYIQKQLKIIKNKVEKTYDRVYAEVDNLGSTLIHNIRLISIEKIKR
jgi:hypothetical protein